MVLRAEIREMILGLKAEFTLTGVLKGFRNRHAGRWGLSRHLVKVVVEEMVQSGEVRLVRPGGVGCAAAYQTQPPQD